MFNEILFESYLEAIGMKKAVVIRVIGLMVLVLGSWGWSQESVSNDIITLMDAVLSKVTQMVQPNTLIGTPIQVGDVTVVPVIKVDVGFGGGGGLGMPAGQPSGGGTGGGITMEPVSFLVIQEGKVTLLSATTPVSPWKDIIETAMPMIMQGLQGMSGMPADMYNYEYEPSEEPIISPVPEE